MSSGLSFMGRREDGFAALETTSTLEEALERFPLQQLGDDEWISMRRPSMIGDAAHCGVCQLGSGPSLDLCTSRGFTRRVQDDLQRHLDVQDAIVSHPDDTHAADAQGAKEQVTRRNDLPRGVLMVSEGARCVDVHEPRQAIFTPLSTRSTRRRGHS